MQHDVFVNPGRRFRNAYPFVVELQANVVESNDRMIAPLVPAADYPAPAGRQTPLVRHNGDGYYLAIPLMGALPHNRLRNPVGTIRAYRDDIVRAIDWLFTGI
jgi:toxin CcdB